MTSTVILGAGIIGVSTAYYLSDHQPPSSIHLVDPSPELFASASGFAGGFVAKDWYAPDVSELGALSFEEHRRLAEAKGGREKWGYSPSTSISYAPPSGDGRTSRRRGDEWLRQGSSRAETATVSVDDTEGRAAPAWLRRAAGDRVERISEDGTTAQVDPLRLSRFLLQECLDRGVQLHHPATALRVHTDARGELASVRIADSGSSTETDVPCTRLIVAAGVWTPRVFASLFPSSTLRIPITSLAGHSLVVESPRWTRELEAAGCHAVFTSRAEGYAPELFSWIGGGIYIAGVNSSTTPVPEVAGSSKHDPEALARLRQTAKELLGPAAGGEGDNDDIKVIREGLCFRPVSSSGKPIISRVEDKDLGAGIKTRPGADGGVFVVGGHGPWGISLSLGTGVVAAELVQGRTLSADVSGLALH
ncbi:hypothetical protein VTK73DRAFT_9957 [Phialemonium thermophilum]|uniref:FAD dependent oxidoreductase domain-containing protein n=1 Tax=Phialemonium thermophilum TaxID=223376 RepID=A0ABR3XIB5_9PEZI